MRPIALMVLMLCGCGAKAEVEKEYLEMISLSLYRLSDAPGFTLGDKITQIEKEAPVAELGVIPELSSVKPGATIWLRLIVKRGWRPRYLWIEWETPDPEAGTLIDYMYVGRIYETDKPNWTLRYFQKLPANPKGTWTVRIIDIDGRILRDSQERKAEWDLVFP